MDIRRFVKPKSSGGGGASTSRGRDESVEPSKKRQRVDSVEMSVEPEPQSHPGAGSTHQSDQRLSSSTDHFADVANYAADGDDDSDLLGPSVPGDLSPYMDPLVDELTKLNDGVTCMDCFFQEW
ncbi:hypothetical protein HOLleu_34212 [Holothuria leucospilota]|uniref:Uncharacterized protein n=1 Tax=Holothuria leucospilota TaxID=206669 RepID=A0A9Q0YU51_HOLLE|nr:hypothetical protein HOLleu_34212 [Holothuria leucospilota]